MYNIVKNAINKISDALTIYPAQGETSQIIDDDTFKFDREMTVDEYTIKEKDRLNKIVEDLKNGIIPVPHPEWYQLYAAIRLLRLKKEKSKCYRFTYIKMERPGIGREIGRLVRLKPSIISLMFFNCDMDKDTLDALADELMGNKTLLAIDLHGVAINNESIPALKRISRHTSVLRIRYNYKGEVDDRDVMEYLIRKNLDYNHIFDGSFYHNKSGAFDIFYKIISDKNYWDNVKWSYEKSQYLAYPKQYRDDDFIDPSIDRSGSRVIEMMNISSPVRDNSIVDLINALIDNNVFVLDMRFTDDCTMDNRAIKSLMTYISLTHYLRNITITDNNIPKNLMYKLIQELIDSPSKDNLVSAHLNISKLLIDNESIMLVGSSEEAIKNTESNESWSGKTRQLNNKSRNEIVTMVYNIVLSSSICYFKTHPERDEMEVLLGDDYRNIIIALKENDNPIKKVCEGVYLDLAQ